MNADSPWETRPAVVNSRPFVDTLVAMDVNLRVPLYVQDTSDGSCMEDIFSSVWFLVQLTVNPCYGVLSGQAEGVQGS